MVFLLIAFLFLWRLRSNRPAGTSGTTRARDRSIDHDRSRDHDHAPSLASPRLHRHLQSARGAETARKIAIHSEKPLCRARRHRPARNHKHFYTDTKRWSKWEWKGVTQVTRTRVGYCRIVGSRRLLYMASSTIDSFKPCLTP